MKTLFTGISETPPSKAEDETNSDPIKTPEDCEAVAWITSNKVREAISSYRQDKAPGPDLVRVSMLKNLPDPVVDYLTSIYQNCLCIGKIPKLWLKSKAIFIPKSSKTNLEDPRSYIPICLSSFLFKTPEKIIQQRLVEFTQIIYPIANMVLGQIVPPLQLSLSLLKKVRVHSIVKKNKPNLPFKILREPLIT